MSEPNPFASPRVTPPVNPSSSKKSEIKIDGSDLAKIEFIIKHAGEVWLMFFMYIPCCVISVALVADYAIRLLQWHRLANKYPELLASGVPPKSLQAKFQSSRWKLIVGFAFAAAVTLILLILIMIPVFYHT